VSDNLFAAIERTDLDAVKRLVAAGTDVNALDIDQESALMRCELLSPRWEIARYLLEHGADLKLHDRYGFGPFGRLALWGAFELVPDYVAAGAKIDDRNSIDGRTGLHVAVQNGQIEMIQALLDHGASPEAAGDDGETPADLARRIDCGELFAYVARLRLRPSSGAALVRSSRARL
jgi:ankyrin repeat protein